MLESKLYSLYAKSMPWLLRIECDLRQNTLNTLALNLADQCGDITSMRVHPRDGDPEIGVVALTVRLRKGIPPLQLVKTSLDVQGVHATEIVPQATEKLRQQPVLWQRRRSASKQVQTDEQRARAAGEEAEIATTQRAASSSSSFFSFSFSFKLFLLFSFSFSFSLCSVRCSFFTAIPSCSACSPLRTLRHK